jgi:hypothetical protein
MKTDTIDELLFSLIVTNLTNTAGQLVLFKILLHVNRRSTGEPIRKSHVDVLETEGDFDKATFVDKRDLFRP